VSARVVLLAHVDMHASEGLTVYMASMHIYMYLLYPANISYIVQHTRNCVSVHIYTSIAESFLYVRKVAFMRVLGDLMAGESRMTKS